jgi:serine protease Do
MTNAHVVEGAEEVIVTLTDKREFKAKTIGSDKRTDVALVKIEATGLPFVRTGDIGRLKVGEWVIAIGSPFGLENTVTAGIVSAKSRDTGEFLPLIQTDVAINPGNSGGPLINMRGEVVGINSQIYSRSGGYMGISFAIPIDEASRVVEQLRVSGRVTRGRIGVVIDQVTKEVAESIGLGKPMGALVRRVEAGGPAEKAGVEAGDIITKVEGRTVDRSGDLPRIVGGMKPGSKARCRSSDEGPTRSESSPSSSSTQERPRRTSDREGTPNRRRPRRRSAWRSPTSRCAAARSEDQGRRQGGQRRRSGRPCRTSRGGHRAGDRKHRDQQCQAVRAAGRKGRPDEAGDALGASRRERELHHRSPGSHELRRVQTRLVAS